MVLSLKVLLAILPDAKCVGLDGREKFDLLDIAHLKQFESLPPAERILYFCVYEDSPEQEGWYKYPFDRSLNIKKVSERNNVVFVVDDRVADEQLHGAKYIRVGNIFRTIDLLRRYVLNQTNPCVIGVTGSVGKTTAAALIQHVLESRFACGRAYSKRLTPLTLSSWLVNFLEPAHEFLVLEYSMYRKHHIGELVEFLPPELGVFLNVKNVHLGVEGIKTFRDILDGKKALIERSCIGFLNTDDVLISELRRPRDLTFSLHNSSADAFIRSDRSDMVLVLNHTGQTVRFAPYIKTDLFCYQVLAAGLVASELGIPPEVLGQVLTTFTPAENRIGWIEVAGEKVLLDGDVTTSGRLLSVAEHQYPTSILMIHSFDFGDEDVSLQEEDFNRAFSMFTVVRVLDTKENRDVVSKHFLKSVTFTAKEEFLTGLHEFEFRILHFATYFRKYSNLSFLKEFIAT